MHGDALWGRLLARYGAATRMKVALLNEAVAVVGSFPTNGAAKGADEHVADEGLPEIRFHWDYRCKRLSSSAALP
jgi:hypothetical protein